MGSTELYDECCSEIEAAYRRLGHTLGWRFLTSSESTFRSSQQIFLLTLQPGGRIDNPHHPRGSVPSGSAYSTEAWPDFPTGEAPLQRQVRALFNEIGARTGQQAPDELLASSLGAYFVPFRAPSWKEFPQKAASTAFAEELWRTILREINPALILVIDGLAFRFVSALLVERGLQSTTEELPIGWGNYVARIRSGRASSPTVCWLPHLSRFAIFGRDASRVYVERIVDRICLNLGAQGRAGRAP